MTWNVDATIGTPVYAIDDRQRTIHGVLGAKVGPLVAVDTDVGGGCTRRRWFHARYVCVDVWRAFEELP